MKRQLIHKLTASMMIAAGILICDPQTIFAQSQPQSGTSSKQAQDHANHGSTNSSAKENSSMNSKSDEAMFVKKASESNLAEIQLSELAMKKSSSAKIKEFAQMMINHHTMAQTELASIISNYSSSSANTPDGDADKMSTMGATGGTTGNAMADGKSNGKYNSSQSNTNSPSDNPSGATTATGSTYSSGNANGAIGTTGNTAGRSSDGAASNNTTGTGSDKGNTGNNADANATTNPSMSPTRVGRGQLTEPGNTSPATGSDANDESDGTGGGGPGANSGGTTSSTNNGRISGTTTDSQDESQGLSTPTGTGDMTGESANTVSSTMKYDMPTELSAEHKAIRDRLVKLSGAEFDKEYMQVMVKDHAKSVELFEKRSYKTDNEQLSAFAAKTLPIIKEHYEMAKKMTGSSGTNKASSGK